MRIHFLLLAGLVIPLSCQRAVVDPGDEPGVLNHVSIGVKDVDLTDISPATRTEIEIDGTVKFSWSADDVVGMYPDHGAPAFFEMTGQDGESVAEFDGGGWALKTASEYAVYYPYDYDFREMEAIPFDYSGQIQVGISNYDHLADYQFMAQGMVQPVSGSCNYRMERIEAIAIFKLTIPVPDDYDLFVMRMADGQRLVYSTSLDISDEFYQITPVGDANQFRVQLQGFTTTSENQTLYVYAMIPPQDLSGKTVILSIQTTEGDVYAAEVDGKNMLNNHAYQYTATLDCDYQSLMEKYGIEDGSWE